MTWHRKLADFFGLKKASSASLVLLLTAMVCSLAGPIYFWIFGRDLK